MAAHDAPHLLHDVENRPSVDGVRVQGERVECLAEPWHAVKLLDVLDQLLAADVRDARENNLHAGIR